jgi:catechol 2,3-dioxygenase-like lactoylglutathione lyase family enzyme
MESFIAKTLKDFEDGKISRRQWIQTIAVAAAVYGAGEEAANAAPSTGFKTIAVNHISYSCPDYTRARDFYGSLMGMENQPDHDSGTQAYLTFGPREGGGWLLPRGANDLSTPNPLQRGGAGGGGRGAAPATAPAATTAPQRPPVTAVIDHIAYTVANFDKTRAEAILKDWGLPGLRPDGDSFHIQDPFGYDVQISGAGMTAFGS